MADRKVLRGFKRSKGSTEPNNGNPVADADEHHNDVGNDTGEVDAPVTGTGDNGTIDPATLSESNGSGTGEKREKRKYTKRNTGNAKESAQNLAGSIFMAHAMLANFIAPEFAINEDSAVKMGEAIAEVQKHFPQVDVIPAKYLALMNLVVVVGKVEGGCLMAYYHRIAEQKKKVVNAEVVSIK